MVEPDGRALWGVESSPALCRRMNRDDDFQMSHRVPAVFIRPRIQGCEIYLSDGLVRLAKVVKANGVRPASEETRPKSWLEIQRGHVVCDV